MQQKVAISAALMSDPPIVLLDEPTLGLDVESARTVREWISQLAKVENKTVLLTTHQLAMAQELCDRIAIINEGRLIADRYNWRAVVSFSSRLLHDTCRRSIQRTGIVAGGTHP